MCHMLSCVSPFYLEQGLLLRDFFLAHDREELINVLKKLNCQTKQISDDIEYEFNSLFTGPGKLLAAPYASVYLDKDKLLMGNSTLSVRNFMLNYGVGVGGNINIPDDHISCEIEFIILLLSKSQGDKQFLKALRQFCNEHFHLWVPPFIESVMQNARTNEIKKTTFILKCWVENLKTKS
ncbi:molecular chaperone TorD family protein [Escherichia coli]|nr:molecular chaperone TorD family protein [Escherichia coli]